MAENWKRAWASKEERDAHDARVDETLRRLREAAANVLARGNEKRAGSS
jgi:hypothetical protein